jgi:hypothetical protein
MINPMRPAVVKLLDYVINMHALSNSLLMGRLLISVPTAAPSVRTGAQQHTEQSTAELYVVVYEGSKEFSCVLISRTLTPQQ